MKPYLTLLALTLLMTGPAAAQLELTQERASRLARLPLAAIPREFPNKLEHVMNDSGEVKSPKELHPAFYGSYDWHSCVHGHWMLVRVLKQHPELPEADQIRRLLAQNLTAENLRAEADYLAQENRKSFERPYGWGWLLKLAEELHTWDDPQGREWARNMKPLTQAIVARYLDFFPRQTYPIRSGVHSNTALGLTFALDYARATGHSALETMVLDRARSYYLADRDYPAAWEPGGDHFLSPALTEADLMSRVLPPDEFQEWLHRFLPRLEQSLPESLLEPAEVSDRSDPKIVHLDGLNLSRAWAMKGIAAVLPAEDPVRAVLLDSAHRHGEDALAHVVSGDYAGEHWLASFAVYLLSR